MKNYADFALGSIIFLVLGFGLMFGSSWNGLIDTSGYGRRRPQLLVYRPVLRRPGRIFRALYRSKTQNPYSQEQ